MAEVPEQAELDLGIQEEKPETTEEVVTEEAISVEPEAELEPPPTPVPSREDELSAQLAQETEQRIRLQERLKAREESPAQQQKPEPPKVFTRQQLRAAVNEGTIDEDQMEEVWATQNREVQKRDTQELIENRDRFNRVVDVVESETSKYLAAYPELQTVGTPDWTKLKREYDFLRSIGDDDSKTTELKAMRAAFGNSTRIPERTAALRETPRETSGAQGAAGTRPVDIWNRVPKEYRDYYKKQVEDGFKTLDDVKKDIPYMRTTSGASH